MIPATTSVQALRESERLIRGGKPSPYWCYDGRCILLGSVSPGMGTIRRPCPHYRHGIYCPAPGEDSRAYNERLTKALAE
jgi:hypothetical protein